MSFPPGFYRMYGCVFLSYVWACGFIVCMDVCFYRMHGRVCFLSNVCACVFIECMGVCFYRRYGRVSIKYDDTVVQTFYIYITFIIPLVW